MKQKILIVIILSSLAAFFLLKNDEREKLLGTFSEIESTLQMEKPLPPLALASRIKKLKNYFDNAVEIEINNYGEIHNFKGFDNIKTGFGMGVKKFALSKVQRDFANVQIQNQLATVNINYIAKATDFKAQQYNEVIAVEATLKKVESDWVITIIKLERMTP